MMTKKLNRILVDNLGIMTLAIIAIAARFYLFGLCGNQACNEDVWLLRWADFISVTVADGEAPSYFLAIGALGTTIVVMNLILAMAWYWIPMFILAKRKWWKVPMRATWFCISFISLALCLSPLALAPIVVTGKGWIIGFGVFTSLLVYGVGTCLFSPSSYKYAPPLAIAIRRW
jgi:hypothetical protein